MSARSELEYTSNIVKKILLNYPETRSSDDLLYFQVCKTINPEASIVPFGNVMINRKKYGLPAFESVRRTRQKIQRACPELGACDDIEAERCIREEEFREYARQ